MGRSRYAFTLVELLVVVSIIGLLIGILMPSLKGARRGAKRAVCASNLRAVGQAMRMYLNDSQDTLPRVEWLPTVPTHDPPWPSIAETLRPHLQEDAGAQPGAVAVFECPADRPGLIDRGEPNGYRSYYQTEGSSYGSNVFLNGQKLYNFVRRDGVIEYFGGQPAEEEIYLLRDYAPFHGGRGSTQPFNFLYIDGHVSDLER